MAAPDRARTLQQACRDPADERRRDGEGPRVQDVREVRARRGDDERRRAAGRSRWSSTPRVAGARSRPAALRRRRGWADRRGRRAGRTRCRSLRRRRAPTIRAGLETNGRAAKTASRPTSEVTIRPLRESRSTSGPNRRPIAIAGTMFASSDGADPQAGVVRSRRRGRPGARSAPASCRSRSRRSRGRADGSCRAAGLPRDRESPRTLPAAAVTGARGRSRALRRRSRALPVSRR